jgi:hypothetical protein
MDEHGRDVRFVPEADEVHCNDPRHPLSNKSKLICLICMAILQSSAYLATLREKEVFEQKSASSPLKRAAAAQAGQWAISRRSWWRFNLYESVACCAVWTLKHGFCIGHDCKLV